MSWIKISENEIINTEKITLIEKTETFHNDYCTDWKIRFRLSTTDKDEFISNYKTKEDRDRHYSEITVWLSVISDDYVKFKD